MKNITLALLLLTSFISIGQIYEDDEGYISTIINPISIDVYDRTMENIVPLPYNINDHVCDWNINNGVYNPCNDSNEIAKLRIRIEELEAMLKRIEAKLDKRE
ncbi:hypothetical protein Phi19:3_gp068 [Cellulophaga phage phi19:3]|uniref:Uncharacterized protein n=1 Tax=Cellulophaga phage phi19:3 TaxID=1327971 RepID=R9ZYW6_9CAUD|nr:hypothetical protein Phi19:3_gp068 [Cellulophaga phage phi19:3]AGO47472.1 hypothetical protein Phi19:3_gp068 [Cellulophaga phage phi19:3]